MDGGGQRPVDAPVVDLEVMLEAERSRFADLLHDGPLSGLLALRQDLLDADPRPADAVDRLDAIVAQVRELTQAHQADVLATVPIAQAIGDVARAAVQNGRAEVDLELGDADLLAPHGALVRSAILELTTNAIRHGGARHIRIATHRTPDGDMELVVTNDGTSIDAALVTQRGREGHIGLARLMQRVGAAGGRMAIECDGGPACVILRLPVKLARGERVTIGSVFDDVVDPWLIVRTDLTYLHVSEAMSRLVGYSRAEMLTTPVDARPWFNDRSAAVARRRQITADTVREGHHVSEVVLRHRDGRLLPTVASSHLLTRSAADGTQTFLALFRRTHDR